MCTSGYSQQTGNSNAAAALATLLTRALCNVEHTPFSIDDVRRMIRQDWNKLCTLAHAVHDEETSEQAKLDKALVRVGELSAFEWKKIVEGRGDVVPTDAAKTVARAILKDEK